MPADKNLPIKFWDDADKPREKLLKHGVKTLSNTELIAILINNGTKEKTAIDLARDVLQSCDNSLPELGKRSVKHFKNIKGIGNVKAIKILAALELGLRRDSDFKQKTNQNFTSSKAIYNYLRSSIVDLNKEIFGILYLNNQNTILSNKIISTGGLTSTVADIRLILKYAFEYDAVAIIVYHNHPSGNLNPSELDISLTDKINQACKQCNIKLLDHFILTTNEYFSFNENEML